MKDKKVEPDDDESIEDDNHLSVQGGESCPNIPGRALLSNINANSHQLQMNNATTKDKMSSSQQTKAQQLQ
jgi:hypothetical protein